MVVRAILPAVPYINAVCICFRIFDYPSHNLTMECKSAVASSRTGFEPRQQQTSDSINLTLYRLDHNRIPMGPADSGGCLSSEAADRYTAPLSMRSKFQRIYCSPSSILSCWLAWHLHLPKGRRIYPHRWLHCLVTSDTNL